jgi:polysaccharide pyruvyl transferase WcaK-like protein
VTTPLTKWPGRAATPREVEMAPTKPDERAPARVNVHVLLAGAFGQGNPGDEALLRSFAQALPGAALTATSSAPAATAREHGIAAVARHDVIAMLQAMRAADAVVFAGGTVFKRLHPSCGRRPLALLARAAAMAVAVKALRRPLALVGVGVGDLHGSAAPRLARVIVRAADLLILRDDESAARLAAAGAPAPVRVGADATWVLPLSPPRADARGPVVVALSHLAGGHDLADRLAAALDPLVRDGLPLVLQPWERTGADDALAHAVAARLDGAGNARLAPVVVLPPPDDLADACADFAEARLVVGLRFHSLIAAAAASTPFLAFVHEPKLAAAARRLDQPRVSAEAPPAAITAAVRAALGAPPAAPEAVARERERAEDAFRLLRVLLAGGRTEEADAIHGLALRPEEWL